MTHTNRETDPLAAHHHPHFISAERTRHGCGWAFQFSPFTGLEAEPTTPNAYTCVNIPWEDREKLINEYHFARIMWGKARFRREAGPALKKAEPVWKSYVRARKAMDGVYASFNDLDDNQWRSTYLAFLDAQEKALSAAQEWDYVAEGLAKLQADHLRTVGETYEELLRDIAPEFGMDIREWHIGWWNGLGHRPNYEDRLYPSVHEDARAQRERIDAVITAFAGKV